MTVLVNNATKPIITRATTQSRSNVTSFEQTKVGQTPKEVGAVDNTNEQLVGKKATVFWDKDGVGELLREDHGSGRGASFQCSNIFSIFAVFVFLFALVDFIMGMDGRRRRRRRDVRGGCDASWLNLEEDPAGGDLEEPLAREASLAVALLWRGNLLSDSHHMDNTFFDSRTTYNTYKETSGKRKKTSSIRHGERRQDSDGCAATIRCKAARSAASLGRFLSSPFPFWSDPCLHPFCH